MPNLNQSSRSKNRKPPASQTTLTPIHIAGDQPKGRLWDSGESGSAESTNQCEELTTQICYWPAQSSHCYDTLAEQEQFLNPPTHPAVSIQEHFFDPHEFPEVPSPTTTNAKSISKPHSALFFDLHYDIFSLYPTHISWHVKVRPDTHQAMCDIVLKHQAIQLCERNPSEPPGFPGFDLPDLEAPMHDSGFFSPSKVRGHSNRWADMLSDSESLPTLQSSSSSEAASVTDASTSRVERSHSHNTPSTECKADNIFRVLASLCTYFELKAITNLHQFSQDLEWIANGPDLTTSNLRDICFHVSLTTPALIKYLRSSQVPHTTGQTLTKVKASADYHDMRAVYHRLLEQGHWPVFQAEAFSVLES